MTKYKVIEDEKEERRKQEEFSHTCFYYATYVTAFFAGFLFLYLRSRHYWIGEMMILSYFNTMVAYLIGVHLLIFAKYCINGYYRAIDSFAIATLPLTTYVNIRTLVLYPWIKWAERMMEYINQ